MALIGKVRLRNSPPQDSAGKMGPGYTRQLYSLLTEIVELVEDSELADLVNALVDEVADLVDRVTTLEIEMAAISDALVTTPDGAAAIRTYDARIERVLDAVLELLVVERERREAEKDEREPT